MTPQEKLQAMKAKAAYFNLLAPLKFFRLFRVFFVMFLSMIVSEYFLIQECCRASEALIRSAGLNLSIYVTRLMASGEMVAHSSSSV